MTVTPCHRLSAILGLVSVQIIFPLLNWVVLSLLSFKGSRVFQIRVLHPMYGLQVFSPGLWLVFSSSSVSFESRCYSVLVRSDLSFFF